MTPWACRRAAGLLDRRAAGLTAAEGQEIELHLGQCASCRAEALLLERLVELATSSDLGSARPGQDAAVIRRALDEGLAVAAHARQPGPRGGPTRWVWAAATVGVVAVVGLAAASLMGRGASGPVASTSPGPAPGAAPGETGSTGTSPPAPLAPAPSAPAASAPEGSAPLASAPPASPPAAMTRAVRELAPAGPQLEREQTGLSFRGGRPAAAGREKPAARPRPARLTLLAQARAELLAGRVAAARRLIARLPAGRSSREEAAEARTLLAECSQLEGQHEQAARELASVADHYPDLQAGEVALYATAGLWSRAGRTDLARAALERYRKRYPAGRFISAVERRLRP